MGISTEVLAPATHEGQRDIVREIHESTAAACASAVGAAETAVNVANAAGSMGLKGIWALVGNSTAMVILAVVLFYTMHEVQALHREGIATMRDLLTGTVANQNRVILDNTTAIRDLAHEVQLLRREREK